MIGPECSSLGRSEMVSVLATSLLLDLGCPLCLFVEVACRNVLAVAEVRLAPSTRRLW